MKSLKAILSLFCSVLILSGCNYLDLVPEDDVLSTDKVFQTRTGALQWMTDTYLGANEPTYHWNYNPAILGADEYTGNDYARKSRFLTLLYIPDGLQSALSPYDDIWAYNKTYYYIRHCNTFLQKIKGVANLKPGELLRWTAQIKAVKAFYYFELLKRYGPFVLVPENIDVWASVEEMRQPRNSIDDCFGEIVKLLDEAIPDLQLFREKDGEMQHFFSKEAAMGLKSRVLLYAASPLFNGGVPQYKNLKNRDGKLLFPQEVDKEKWRIAAEYADEAILYLEGQGYKLFRGTTTESTPLLNTMRDLELSQWAVSDMNPTSESIMLVASANLFFQDLLPRLGNSSSDPYYSSMLFGDLGTNIKMVNKYYTANGLPMEEDKTWKYGNGYTMSQEKDPAYTNVIPLGEDVLSLHLQREPRFYASIAAPGLYWKLGNSSAENFLVDSRQGGLFGLKKDRVDASVNQNITGYYVKKGTRSDCALNDYLTTMQAKVGKTAVVMRLAEIYLNAAEAWNEYEGPNGVHRDNIFNRLNDIRERAGIPTVQESWNKYGTNSTKYNDQKGLRDIIHRERTIEFMFEGHRFWDIRRWGAGLTEGLNEKPLGWKVVGKTWREFYNNYQGPVVVWNKASFDPSRDYFWPIRSEEVNISGIVQNPGW